MVSVDGDRNNDNDGKVMVVMQMVVMMIMMRKSVAILRLRVQCVMSSLDERSGFFFSGKEFYILVLHVHLHLIIPSRSQS